jgi:hypothetical protein
MRALAGRLRVQAAETRLTVYQLKFHVTAAELEEAARDLESHVLRSGFRLAS